MSNAALHEAMELALAEYNQCSEELAGILDMARVKNGLTPALMEKIRDTNTRCNELLETYLAAYRAYYAVVSTDVANN